MPVQDLPPLSLPLRPGHPLPLGDAHHPLPCTDSGQREAPDLLRNAEAPLRLLALLGLGTA